MPLKKCSKCKEWKDLEYFPRNKNKKYGRDNRCKECRRKDYKEHAEERRQYARKYRQEHKEERAKWRKEHKEYQREYYKEHKEKIAQQQKNYQQEHRKERNQRERIRHKIDPQFRLNWLMSNAIRKIKNPLMKKGRSWKQLVPYSLFQLKKHLISTLPEGYTWEDFMEGNLHIDHILPQAIFKYEKAEDLGFQICWGLGNLRLLPAKENMRKKAKLIKPFQKHFSMEIEIKNKRNN